MSRRANHRFQRRAAAAAMVAVCGTVLIGFAALAIDMGVFYNTRIEAQRSADAAAMAGAWKLLGDQRLSQSNQSALVEQARQAAAGMAGKNPIFKKAPDVDTNYANSLSGDILLGRLNNIYDRNEQLDTSVDALDYNAISVLVRRDDVRNGPVPFFFGQIFGLKTKNMSARAVAAAQNRIAGFRVTETSGNAKLLPFAVHVDAWNDLVSGLGGFEDNYTYDPETKTVSAGGDGIPEVNMYPGGGQGGKKDKGNPAQLTPGNFGTVDIGASNNSTADLKRQIAEGVNQEDLNYLGGELKFDQNGKIYLNGDTGLSAAIKDPLEQIKGQGRVIPLFSQVSGPGNNAYYTVVAFAGMRVMNVRLTGSMNSKEVIVQPAVVIDQTAITSQSAQPSSFVYTAPTLVR